MPFDYAVRTRSYIDLSQATPEDRIKVTLSDQQIITLRMQKESQQRSGRLVVDLEHTTSSILEALYQSIIANERRHQRGWFGNSVPSLDKVRATARLEVSINASGDAFDDSPRPGERLCIMATLPGRGGSGWHTPQEVAKVEFYTLHAVPTSNSG
ncbi:MAG: hypothetical protein JWN38_410 [Candidatus Saccharibacteria bacterium]|nr:hypothetical protein [Candidatus Saccharibacteria bacterium]